MDHQLYYLELSQEVIRFEPVSQLTNVFFDDSNKQVFAVRSGGATGVVVKGLTESQSMSFCMDDKGPIQSIKFNPDIKILGIQRLETCVEFIVFTGNQPNLTETIMYKGKNSIIYGFVWIHAKEVALITSDGIEMIQINVEKRQVRQIKSLGITINWFIWNQQTNLTVLSTNERHILTLCILKQGIITKLPKLEYDKNRNLCERDVTLGQLYGAAAILMLRPNAETRFVEVVIYCLIGPGLAPRKCYILRLCQTGRFAMNIVNDLVAVHHQTSRTSMLFDVSIAEETDSMGITTHMPITPPKPLKPFVLKLPSLSLEGHTMNCELYSPNWVLFQPNIVIDAKLGCLWNVELNLDALKSLITDRVRLVELLLHRTNGQRLLVEVLKEMTGSQYNGTMLPVIENVFDKINKVYGQVVNAELQQQIAQPPSMAAKSQATKQQTTSSPLIPKVFIDQSVMFTQIFVPLADADYIGCILMIYLNSLAKHKIAAQHDISKMIIIDLVRNHRLDTLRQLISFSLICESKPLACFLLSLSNVDKSITQCALDMLHKLYAHQIIVEVFLGQGKVTDALRLAKSLPGGSDTLSARKYLEAAMKTTDPITFHTVYTFFQQRNIMKRGSANFVKSELCDEYDDHYRQLFLKDERN